MQLQGFTRIHFAGFWMTLRVGWRRHAQGRTVRPDRDPVLRGTPRLFSSRDRDPWDGGVERRECVFQSGRRRRVPLLRPQRIHPDVQLRGRVPGRRLRRQLHALCLGSPDENLSRSLLDAAAGAAHRDLQSAPPPRLARRALPSLAAAVLLAVLDTDVFEVFERSVMEHQLRVVLLSPCPGGHVLRVRESPSLGVGGCGHGLCVRPRVLSLAWPIRGGAALFRVLVRSLEVCGVSRGCLLGPRLSDIVGTKTRWSFRPGAGDGSRADRRWRRGQAVRGLATRGRVAVSAWRGSSRPWTGLWSRGFRGSLESALAQAAGDGQLLPLPDPCPSSTRSQRRLPLLGMGSALVARLRGCRDGDVHGRPDRGVAHLLRVRAPIAKALEEFAHPAARGRTRRASTRCSCGGTRDADPRQPRARTTGRQALSFRIFEWPGSIKALGCAETFTPAPLVLDHTDTLVCATRMQRISYAPFSSARSIQR